MGKIKLKGYQYFRPEDSCTLSKPNQKFFQQEVFKTDKTVFAYSSDVRKIETTLKIVIIPFLIDRWEMSRS